MRSGLQRCIMAQKANPSLHEVVMLDTRTFLYPTVCRLHHSSNASFPRNVPAARFFCFLDIFVGSSDEHLKHFPIQAFTFVQRRFITPYGGTTGFSAQKERFVFQFRRLSINLTFANDVVIINVPAMNYFRNTRDQNECKH